MVQNINGFVDLFEFIITLQEGASRIHAASKKMKKNRKSINLFRFSSWDSACMCVAA